MPLIKSALQPMRSGQRRSGYGLNFINSSYEPSCLSCFCVNSYQNGGANTDKAKDSEMATNEFYVRFLASAFRM